MELHNGKANTENLVYLGHTILGKTKKASLKSKKKLAVPEENWFITENTHTPLVTKEQFDQAAYFMGMNTKNWQGYEKCRSSIFNGLTFCAHCGGAMCSSGTVYKGERMKYWLNFRCNNIPKRSKNHCEHGARIKYTDLLEIISRPQPADFSCPTRTKKRLSNRQFKVWDKLIFTKIQRTINLLSREVLIQSTIER